MRIATIFFLPVCLMLIASAGIYGQSYVSPFKNDNGTIKMKSRDEIRAEESRNAANKSNANYPKEYEKPKSGVKDNGEIWIDGYCRYRPPSYSRSRYNEDMSEVEYCKAVYPTETIVQSDDFKWSGNIPWAVNSWNSKEECEALQLRIAQSVNDGIPFKMYDSLAKMSAYNEPTARGYKEGRKYEFSRSVSIWIKRKSGSEKSSVKFSTEYAYSNGEDRTDLEVNDKGQFKVSRFCDNCKSPMYKEVESGKSKAWKEGEWNELTIKKDEFNTVTVFINDEEVCRYQLSSLPITARFATFSFEMPYKWEKEKLLYHVGQVTSISYPKVN